MPCRDDRNEAPYQLNECQQRLNLATRLLCRVCRNMELTTEPYNPIQAGTDKELSKWWEEHKQQDAVRKLREQEAKDRRRQAKAEEERRQAAIASLTPAQRQALGL